MHYQSIGSNGDMLAHLFPQLALLLCMPQATACLGTINNEAHNITSQLPTIIFQSRSQSLNMNLELGTPGWRHAFRMTVPVRGESAGRSPVDSPFKVSVMWGFDILYQLEKRSWRNNRIANDWTCVATVMFVVWPSLLVQMCVNKNYNRHIPLHNKAFLDLPCETA